MDRNFSHDERKKNLLKTFLSVVLSFAFEAKAKNFVMLIYFSNYTNLLQHNTKSLCLLHIGIG